MKRLIIGTAAVALLFAASAASAGDIKGTIKSMNGNDRTVSLTAGTDTKSYYFLQTTDMTGLTTGMTVTFTFVENNGRNEVSKVVK